MTRTPWIALAAFCAAVPAWADDVPPAAPAPADEAEHAIEFSGYAKLDLGFTQPDPTFVNVGQNGGMRLLGVRLVVEGRPTGHFGFEVSVDAAVDQREKATTLLGRKIVELKDAIAWYEAGRFVTVRGGQFKAPFGAEPLLGDGDLPFIERSLVSRGGTAPESRDVAGMSLDRQIGFGARVGTTQGAQGLGGAFELAIVNGNGANAIVNDNNLPMLVGRLEGAWGETATVGVSGYVDPHTIADAQGGRYDEVHLGVGFDVAARLGPVQVLAMALGRQTQYPATGQASSLASGVMAQAVWMLPETMLSLQIGLRGAIYEPSTLVQADRLAEVNVLVALPLSSIPLRIALQGSLRFEEAPSEVNNHGIDLLFQAYF